MKKKKNKRAGGMAHWLREHAACPRNQNSVPSTRSCSSQLPVTPVLGGSDASDKDSIADSKPSSDGKSRTQEFKVQVIRGPVGEEDFRKKAEGKCYKSGGKRHLKRNSFMEKGTENKIVPLMSFDKDSGNQVFLFNGSHWEPLIYLRLGSERKQIAFLGQLWACMLLSILANVFLSSETVVTGLICKII